MGRGGGDGTIRLLPRAGVNALVPVQHAAAAVNASVAVNAGVVTMVEARKNEHNLQPAIRKVVTSSFRQFLTEREQSTTNPLIDLHCVAFEFKPHCRTPAGGVHPFSLYQSRSMPPGGKKKTGGGGAAASAASTSTNNTAGVGTSTTATTMPAPGGSPSALTLPMALPQLNLDIYNYFLSINGGTNATGTAAAAMDTEPILQAIRSAFPDQSFPGSTGAAPATAATAGTSTSNSNQQNQQQALVRYYTFHPFLLRRIKNLEDEVKELRSSAAGGGGVASVVTPPVAAATPGSRTSAGGRQASSLGVSRSNSSSSKKRSRETNGIAAASRNTSTAAALQEEAPGQPAAKRPALTSASASAAPRTTVDIAEMARALAAASTSKKKSSKQQQPPRGTKKSTPSSSSTTTKANRKSPMPPNEKTWAEMYADLEHCQAGYCHCRVSRSDTDHPYLSKWVQKMRSAYKAYQEA